ncbi:MAG: thiamine-phosphate kinase [Gammaproteobacteria bacterium]|nr:thiamine-phosphate kinase [Gammaproteobacteria bacterium]
MASEFDLIERYFRPLGQGAGVALGIGDDTAILDPGPGCQLLVTVDTLVAGVHFPEGATPPDIGYKTLAVSLSDIAAMGGTPRWATLALTLPSADETWLAAFARGLGEACSVYGVALVGGDTTRGPLTLSLQLLGEVAAGRALRRDGARAGDGIYVTGTLGDAGLGLACELEGLSLPPADAAHCRGRLHRPTPRLAVGQGLHGLATAAIDVSDGLLADLGHLLERSGVGAELRLETLPLSSAMRAAMAAGQADWHLPLAAGDDYELLFTAPIDQEAALAQLASAAGCPITRIGRILAGTGTRVLGPDGQPWQPARRGYDHFGNPRP